MIECFFLLFLIFIAREWRNFAFLFVIGAGCSNKNNWNSQISFFFFFSRKIHFPRKSWKLFFFIFLNQKCHNKFQVACYTVLLKSQKFETVHWVKRWFNIEKVYFFPCVVSLKPPFPLLHLLHHNYFACIYLKKVFQMK